MNRKAVFFDIDGTLYIQGKPLIKSTLEAIKRIRENGHLAFICTGRSRVMVPKTPILDIGFDGIIASCGTYGEYQGEELFRRSLSRKELSELMLAYRKYHAMYILEGTEYIYYDEEMVEDLEKAWYLKHINDTIPDSFLQVGETEHIDACKASIHVKNAGSKELYRLFEKKYEILEHEFGVAEFVPKGFSKAKGIARMCEYLGIDVADTIAVGDSINDVDMLKFANVGICMGNGSDPAKACADYITDELQNDGIYHAMKHFGLI